MALELLKERWSSAINVLKVGAVKEEGGTRASAITVGGQTTLPFLLDEGGMPHRPVVAMEIFDVARSSGRSPYWNHSATRLKIL